MIENGARSDGIQPRTTAAEMVRLWFHDATAPIHVQDSENSVYAFEAGIPARRFFLRLTHPEHRSYEQINAEVEFILYLEEEGCRVSRPVVSRHDRLVEKIFSEEDHLLACVFEAAPGFCVEVASSDWGPKLFQLWGNYLGRLHCASKLYVPKGLRRFRWNEDELVINPDKYLPANETNARLEWEHVIEWLSQSSTAADRFGLIHGDLCRVNFHYDDQEIIAFDLDDCCYHWFIYDLVCALSAATFRPAEERRAYRDWLVAGYQQVQPLHEGWKEDFDWLLRLRGVYIFTHYLRKAKGDVQNHPKRRLLELLRNSFAQPITW